MRAKPKPSGRAKQPLRFPAPEPERDALILALARQAKEALIRDELKVLIRLLRAAVDKKSKQKGSTLGRWRRRMRKFEVLDAWGDRFLMDPEEKYRRAVTLGFEGWESLTRAARRYLA